MEKRGPLDGITVLDLTRVLAGPFCTMLLSDLGARVIKVEKPGRGDDSRHIGPFAGERSAYFTSLNRGKESIALDLSDENDRAIFDQLLAISDVLVENFRPGAMEKLGYGWTALHERFPALIYAAASGFGDSGPYRRRPAYDLVVQAMGGVMSLTGPAGGPPTRVGTSIGDLSAGLFTCIAINAALFARSQSGQGQKIDVSMLDCQVAILENAIARFETTGEVPGPLGSRHPSITPFAAFEARDGALVIAAGNDDLFARLCHALGRGELAARSEFASNDARTRNHEQLHRELEAALAGRSRDEWLAILEKAGVACGPIQDVAQVLADPQVLARNMVVEIEGPAGGIRAAGNPIKWSGFPDPATRPPAPELDEHRDSLLAALNGSTTPIRSDR